MAIAGAGGWIPSNWAALHNGSIIFLAITQNKPPHLVPTVEDAAAALLAGQRVTVDVRWSYISQLRALIAEQTTRNTNHATRPEQPS